MARMSKTPFTIYNDISSTTHGSKRQEQDDIVSKKDKAHGVGSGACDPGEEAPLGNDADVEDTAERSSVAPEGDVVAEGEESDLDAISEYDRRISVQTRATVSTLPESEYETEPEADTGGEGAQALKCYTPPVMRPSFRRPESVRRMQMTSPPPADRYSPRHPSTFRNGNRSRNSTPRSVRSPRIEVRGSPKPRTRRCAPIDSETDGEQEGQADKPRDLPLVLLHVTLLPVSLPWSSESMQTLLPTHVWENLQLLRSKASDTIVRRGVLIPHPREEYELLETRLLEALELRSEMVTKCGHYRARESLESAASDKSGLDSDSGVGSSLSGSETASVCSTCHHHVKSTASAVGRGRKKWSVRVFAANGLMRAAAWSAAWNEMERVDVEITPWIDEELRRKLDERREEEDAEETRRRNDEGERVRVLVAEQVRLEFQSRALEEERRRLKAIKDDSQTTRHTDTHCNSPSLQPSPPFAQHSPDPTTSAPELPRVYQPTQVPLSLLLKNYMLLQLKDRRAVAILFCSLLALLYALRSAATATTPSTISSEARVVDLEALPVLALSAESPVTFNDSLEPVSVSSSVEATKTNTRIHATADVDGPTAAEGEALEVVDEPLG